MTITDATVHDIALGLPLIGVNTWGRNTEWPALHRAYAYSSTQVLKVSERGDGVVWNPDTGWVPDTGGWPEVKWLWFAYCWQQATGPVSTAMSVVYDVSPTGCWILQERAIDNVSYFDQEFSHYGDSTLFDDTAGLEDLVQNPWGSCLIGMMLDDRLALIDAGLPPIVGGCKYDIGLYDPAWMPAPF